MAALALWLHMGDQGDTMTDHASLKCYVCSREALEERRVLRAAMQEDPDLTELFDDLERKKRDDTDSEPLVIPN